MSDGTNPTKNPLTQREAELVIMAIQCLKKDCLQIDWEKFATMAEFKNKASANASFGNLVKHKLSTATVDNFYVAPGGAIGSTPRKRRQPIKKGKTDAEGDGASDHSDQETPTKKRAKKDGTAAPAKKRGKASPQTQDNFVKGSHQVHNADMDEDVKDGEVDVKKEEVDPNDGSESLFAQSCPTSHIEGASYY